MPWRNADSVLALSQALNGEDLLQAAKGIESLRSSHAESVISRFHGFAVDGVMTTAFMYQAGLVAREQGCFASNGLERDFLPIPDNWVHPTLTAKDYDVALVGDQIISSKSWPFCQDASVADFQVNASPKWWSHGLVHSLVGFGFWSDMCEWEVALMARLGEAIASLHWYWLSELERTYCPMHTVASGDGTPDCRECRILEEEAKRADIRRKRLESAQAASIAQNAIGVLQYEALAYEHGFSRGELLVPKQRYLELGEACDYALFHHRRLTSDAFRRYADACLEEGRDYAGSLSAFSSRACHTLQTLLTPQEASDSIASKRERRVLQDLGARLCQLGAAGAIEEAHWKRGLALIHDGLGSIDASSDASSSLGKTLDALAGVVPAPAAATFFCLGYAPCSDPSAEPEVARKAREDGYMARLEATGSPLAPFIAKAPEALAALVNRTRMVSVMDELFEVVSEDLDTEDMGLLMRQAFLGWLVMASQSWGPENAARSIGERWYYRLAPASMPQRDLWGAYRLRPNPYLSAIPMGFDVDWLDKMWRGKLEEFRPKAATRLMYAVVGPGRKHPILLPYVGFRKRLWNALQHTPSLEELVVGGQFSEEMIAQAIEDEFVICLHQRDAITLYAEPMVVPPEVDSGESPVNVAVGALKEAGPSPWERPDQAHYYEAYCTRSTLYEDLATALVQQVTLPAEGVVIDLGCGTGISTGAILAKLGSRGKVIALDPSPRMVEATTRLVPDPRLQCMVGDAFSIPVLAEHQQLDAVVCNSAIWLNHDLGGALAAIGQALTEGAHLLLSIPAEFLGYLNHRVTPEAESFAGVVSAARKKFGATGDATDALPHVTLLGSLDRFEGGLKKAGFTSVDALVWTRPWSAAEYLDWLSQPVLRDGMCAGLSEEDTRIFMAHLEASLDMSTPLESAWYLVRATR
jgi:SAM-dependent methyltransferase